MTYMIPNNDFPRDIYILARIHTFRNKNLLIMKYQASMSKGNPGVSEWDPLGGVLYIFLHLTLLSTFKGQTTSIRIHASVFFLEGLRQNKINAKEENSGKNLQKVWEVHIRILGEMRYQVAKKQEQNTGELSENAFHLS